MNRNELRKRKWRAVIWLLSLAMTSGLTIFSILEPAEAQQSPAPKEPAELRDFLDRMEGFGRPGLFGPRRVDRHVRNDAGEIVELRLNGVQLRPGDAQLIGKLTSLARINLSETNVSDEDIAALAQLAALRSLALHRTHIGGKALAGIAKLEGLEQLDISSTKIGDEDLNPLVALTNLRVLSLRGTLITDRGLSSVAQLTQLTQLSLGGTNITDAGLRSLEGLTQLRALTLEGTHVSEAGLKRLATRAPFAWISAPDQVVSEFVQRLELGQYASAREMYVAGPFVPEQGTYELIGMKELVQTSKDSSAGRQRFSIDLRWKKNAQSQDTFIHAELAVDRGAVSILEVELDE